MNWTTDPTDRSRCNPVIGIPLYRSPNKSTTNSNSHTGIGQRIEILLRTQFPARAMTQITSVRPMSHAKASPVTRGLKRSRTVAW